MFGCGGPRHRYTLHDYPTCSPEYLPLFKELYKEASKPPNEKSYSAEERRFMFGGFSCDYLIEGECLYTVSSGFADSFVGFQQSRTGIGV